VLNRAFKIDAKTLMEHAARRIVRNIVSMSKSCLNPMNQLLLLKLEHSGQNRSKAPAFRRKNHQKNYFQNRKYCGQFSKM
jgi:hypothetical protein